MLTDNAPLYYHCVHPKSASGEFCAHVENEAGDVVFTISSAEADEEPIFLLDEKRWLHPVVDAGYMKNPDDMVGLQNYLSQIRVLPTHAEIINLH